MPGNFFYQQYPSAFKAWLQNQYENQDTVYQLSCSELFLAVTQLWKQELTFEMLTLYQCKVHYYKRLFKIIIFSRVKQQSFQAGMWKALMCPFLMFQEKNQ